MKDELKPISLFVPVESGILMKTRLSERRGFFVYGTCRADIFMLALIQNWNTSIDIPTCTPRWIW
jgi:hypothetical protein